MNQASGVSFISGIVSLLLIAWFITFTVLVVIKLNKLIELLREKTAD